MSSTALAARTAPSAGGPQVVRQRRVVSWSQPWVYLVALVVAGLTIAPVLFVVLGGFRTNFDLALNPADLPDPWIFGNYLTILTGDFAGRFWGQVLASSVIALGTTALVIALGVAAAYAIARFDDVKGRMAIYSLFAAGLMFPATIAILPLTVMLQWLGLFGHWWGVIIPQVAFALPVTVVILTPFLKAIPKELEEAAEIDGAGPFKVFWRIMLPLAKPGMVTVGVLAFVGSWNGYMLPLFVLGVGGAPVEQHTLPLGLQMFSSQFSANTAGIMAFTTLSLIPALIFFLTMEKHIVSGLSGAVKG